LENGRVDKMVIYLIERKIHNPTYGRLESVEILKACKYESNALNRLKKYEKAKN